MAKRKSGARTKRPRVPAQTGEIITYEVEVAPGLEIATYQEIEQRLGRQLYQMASPAEQRRLGIIEFTYPQPADKFLNLTCGSGTLLIERLLAAPARRMIGCDIDAGALQYAEQNLTAAGLQDLVELYKWDARSLNLPDGSIDAICADLPMYFYLAAHGATCWIVGITIPIDESKEQLCDLIN